MKPKIEDRKKFDIDLTYGTIREEKISVKAEIDCEYKRIIIADKW